MTAASGDSELDWVLILAPFRKDADYIAALLLEQKIAVKAVPNEDLTTNLFRSPGVIVITHEALNPAVVSRVGEHLAAQPDWSEVPIIILLERGAPIARIRHQLLAGWPGARVLFHTRPVAPLELVNSVQSNLLVRLRQRQVRDSIERERELRLELNHRVKNILASVTSIFRMTKRGAATIEELTSTFTSRMQALSDVHTAVFEAGGEEISLSSIMELTVSPYNNDDVSHIKVDGPDIRVSREAGTTIALCLHELITNAIKYGALSSPDGRVEIAWQISSADDPVFSLNWTEAGGPSVIEPTRQGYGTRYVRTALETLFGATPKITFGTAGVRCSVAGQLSRMLPQGEGL